MSLSTLERIDMLEKTVSQLSAQAELTKMALPEISKVVGDVGNLRASLTESVQQLGTSVDRFQGNQQQYMNYVVQRMMGLEQALASVTKTVAAMMEELESSAVFTSNDIMARIRKGDENAEKERIQSMLEQKTIESVAEATVTSLVVVAQSFLTKDGKSETVAEYRVLDLLNNNLPVNIKQQFEGKKVGDTFSTEETDGSLRTTLLAIYKLAEQIKAGEALSESTEQSALQSAQ